MRRVLTGSGLAVALVLLAGGLVLAVHGALGERGGPAAVVGQYFAALQRGDASAALSCGTMPAGSQTLVSDAALRNQQRAAPLRHLVVLSTRTRADTAVVTVGYDLDFASGPVTVSDDLALHQQDGEWLLDATAIPTRFAFSAAAQRASIAGFRVPRRPALVFPGAIALRFDSPYLSGAVGNGYLTFSAPATTKVEVSLTASGRRAVAAGALAALRRCLHRGGDGSCPQPDERYLPGSLHGTLEGALRATRVALTSSPVGLVALTAQATARVSYARLDFTDQLRRGHGTVGLVVAADIVAARPMSVRWTG